MLKAETARTFWWNNRRYKFESKIRHIKSDIQKLKEEIENLASTAAAEVSGEANNNWSSWILSSITNNNEDSEEVKAQKEIKRQERRIEKDMKERKLTECHEKLKAEEALLKKAQEEENTAARADESKKREIRNRSSVRERKQKEREAREDWLRQERVRKQREEERLKREKAASDAAKDAWTQQQEDLEKRSAEFFKPYQRHWEKKTSAPSQPPQPAASQSQSHHTSTPDCIHDGRWAKNHGRRPCPQCSKKWHYLLMCPGCAMEACPKCQARIRPRLYSHFGESTDLWDE